MSENVNHDCGKFTYEYIKVYRNNGKWFLEVDKQSEFEIIYCPFCGELLDLGDE